MFSKEDGNRLYHMLEAAREAAGYAEGRKRGDLQTDRPLTHSLVRCLEIVGEAASKVTTECRKSLPQIQWEDMIGMRNRLIHAYFDVNLDIVWKTVKDELPPLIAELETIINSK
ncbi:MAG: DUF86 domain-containing protein [Sedimentisphaerales bacterium]|nr:DUF86 domain-containing protein [Sedimentisphaerales bacterium]